MARRAFAVMALATLAAAAGAEEPESSGYEEAPPVDVSVDVGAPGASVTFDTFHRELSPYGQWGTVAPYGQVWRPNVPVGWRPYYYGHWAWTDEGWLWVSDEPWGWGPYHYGRWAFDASWGWFWVPGYQWAPAWVSWRFSGDVVGWAPLAPGFSIYVSSFPVFYSAWTFVPCTGFVGVPVHRYAYAPSYYPGFFRRTQPAPPRATVFGATTPAWGGPAHRAVEQRVGRAIPATPITPVSTPAQARRLGGGAVPVFRPPASSPAPSAGPRTHPGWGSPARPGWGPPGRVPAPSAAPGSRPADNRPGWGTPPSRGPAPVPPGPRSAPAAGQRDRGEGAPRGGYAPAPRGGGYPPAGYGPAPRGYSPAAPAPRGGGYAPAPRGGGYAPAPRGGGYAPAPRGGGYAPAPRGGGYAPAPRGGGYAPAPGGGRAAPGAAAAPRGGGRSAPAGRGEGHRH